MFAFPTKSCSKKGKGIASWHRKPAIAGRYGEGRLAVDTATANFTPHVLNILVGEDIFQKKILSVVQMSPRAVCILSAVGAVAIVDMCLAGYFGCGVLRYEKKKPLGLLPMVAASGGEFQQIRLTSWVAPNGRNKRRRVLTNQTVINSDVYMNLEVSSGSMASFTVC
ncbi:AT-hook motif nuclear-localized protein 9-like isoform X1 [Rhododendron vialii]|uniref:AT-hook motif nuclear-localized protein 9-like isoform X1 n=1 Tax=Rhododendron vialii TaxID=182163 RepID=UPI0026600709|nr:AT-hook motif nuclear-localized protein 9-like isoform X1 [Rhododendron vialii]